MQLTVEMSLHLDRIARYHDQRYNIGFEKGDETNHQLIIGCGEAGRHNHSKRGISTFDMDASIKPNITGDITKKDALRRFDQKFSTIFFENFPMPRFSIETYSKIVENVKNALLPDGEICIVTGRFLDKEPIVQVFQDCGFSVRVDFDGAGHTILARPSSESKDTEQGNSKELKIQKPRLPPYEPPPRVPVDETLRSSSRLLPSVALTHSPNGR